MLLIRRLFRTFSNRRTGAATSSARSGSRGTAGDARAVASGARGLLGRFRGRR